MLALALSAPRAGAGDPVPQELLPDLVVAKPAELYVVDRGRRTKLRFSHTTANVGDGPLEIAPDLTTTNCASKGPDWFDADQYIYRDQNGSGEFERGLAADGADGDPDRRHAGCMYFHAPHDHYHFRDFAEYNLYREPNAKPVARSDKVSFCVFDLRPFQTGLPGSEVYYSFTNCNEKDGTHGISVGWADVYSAGTPGQVLDITKLRRGRYCLVAEADPLDRLVETSPERSNTRRIRIALRPRRGVVKRLAPPCRSF